MLDSVFAFLNTPLGAAILLGLGIAAPKLPAGLGSLVSFVLQLLKARVPATPATPAVPAPDAPAGRPLVDAALKILAGIAARRFPQLSAEEALERHLVEQANTAYYRADVDREKAAG